MSTSNLQDKLFASGLVEKGDAELIQKFKQQHRKVYEKQRDKGYALTKKRKTLIFSNEEFAYLETEAKKYDLKLSPFLKAAIFAYLEQTFVFPDQETICQIERNQQDLNNRIAQTIQYVHLSANVTYEDIDGVLKEIKKLEILLTGLQNPLSLHQWLESQIKRDRTFISKLLRVIATYLP